MINVASPAAAFRWWRLPAKGIGLARMEFIINNLIKIHPMALVHFDTVKDRADRARRSMRLTRASRTRPSISSTPSRVASRRSRAVVSAPGHRAAERLQDQRIRPPDRRLGLRADGREPDARAPRRLALLHDALPRGLRAGMPGDPEGARGDRLRQRDRHGALLPHARGGGPGPRGDGRERPQAGRATGFRSMSCARSPRT